MNQKGVTLVELVIVFVIIAIGATLMAPGIGTWLPRYRLMSATNNIVSTMRMAQLRAVSTGLTYQVSFPTGNSYILQYLNTLGVLVPEGSTQTLPPGITMNTASLPGATAVFSSNSTCSGGSMTLSYLKGGITQAQKGIFLNVATGRITTQ